MRMTRPWLLIPVVLITALVGASAALAQQPQDACLGCHKLGMGSQPDECVQVQDSKKGDCCSCHSQGSRSGTCSGDRTGTVACPPPLSSAGIGSSPAEQLPRHGGPTAPRLPDALMIALFDPTSSTPATQRADVRFETVACHQRRHAVDRGAASSVPR